MVDELMASPYLTRFPASLDPSPFPTTVRFREPPAPTGGSLPDWWDGSDAPLVYVTFGTVLGYMTLAADVFRTALAAVHALDVRVLLTVGHRFDPGDLGPIPGNVHVESWVDQVRVFAEADLVVCHGGSGTVFGAVAAGIPLVVVPVFADQFENGHRVRPDGSRARRRVRAPACRGVRVRSSRKRTRRALPKRSRRCWPPRRFAISRGAIATEMAATPTVDEVLGPLGPG